jgi:protein-S-isoprenylcysteine O-methyltransferase Ste14
LLFLGSTSFTESITLARYPEYAAYQRAVSRLLPWRPRRP